MLRLRDTQLHCWRGWRVSGVTANMIMVQSQDPAPQSSCHSYADSATDEMWQWQHTILHYKIKLVIIYSLALSLFPNRLVGYICVVSYKKTSSWIGLSVMCDCGRVLSMTSVTSQIRLYTRPDISTIVLRLRTELVTIDEISRHLLGLDEIKSESINCYKWNVTALNVI